VEVSKPKQTNGSPSVDENWRFMVFARKKER
jgi:hypothetical protein